MRAAILSGSTVTRVVMLDNLQQMPGAIDGTGADVGDTWNGSAFVKPAPATTVPAEVTARQAKRAMFLSTPSITEAQVMAVINAMSDPDKTLARYDWEESNTFQRNNPTLIALATALGLNSAQIDALFISAASQP